MKPKTWYVVIASIMLVLVIAVSCSQMTDGQKEGEKVGYTLGPIVDSTEAEIQLKDQFSAKIGAAVGIAWPFGGAESPDRWVGWQGDRYGGRWTQTGCGYRHTHSGADYHARDLSRPGCEGVKVYAGFTGRVIRAGSNGGYGNTVVVHDAARRIALRYSHLATVGVTMGQWVNWGQYIGTVGNTGNSSSPHLHLAAYENINDNGGNPIIPTLCDSDYYTCAAYFYCW